MDVFSLPVQKAALEINCSSVFILQSHAVLYVRGLFPAKDPVADAETEQGPPTIYNIWYKMLLHI